MKLDRRLIHYGSSPLKEIRSAEQADSSDLASFNLKPSGLWVSCEGEQDWPEWCKAEDYNLDGLKFATEIVLSPKAKMLVIRNTKEFTKFEAEFLKPRSGIRGQNYQPEYVAWPEVARRYQGIIICPYLWKHRLSGNIWYYGWDCASGCIWDANAVAKIKPIEADPPAAHSADLRE